MQKKYLVPTVLFIIILLSLVGSIAYKQFNKSPFTDNKPVETLAPKETEEIKQKSENSTTDSVREAGDGKSLDELAGIKPDETKTIIVGETNSNGEIEPNRELETNSNGE